MPWGISLPLDTWRPQTRLEYVLTCFRSHDSAISLEPVIAGPVAAIKDAAWESVQDAVELVAERFQRDPADDP
jgi:hypothetical protein